VGASKVIPVELKRNTILPHLHRFCARNSSILPAFLNLR